VLLTSQTRIISPQTQFARAAVAVLRRVSENVSVGYVVHCSWQTSYSGLQIQLPNDKLYTADRRQRAMSLQWARPEAEYILKVSWWHFRCRKYRIASA